ncbi:MAG: hypothetical protein JW709_12565 [Sedimentisphaerales bacterium]|nr:hypothetical protein [Sedimentisphaerales bacterium]
MLDEIETHGFLDARGGYRLLNDPYEKDMSLMESRLQLDMSSMQDWADLKFKGDVIGDLVTEDYTFDMREANIAFRPLDFMDAKVGRQILTWGTGDLIFINDLFPKDWQAFFIGRDVEYLKAPSDAAKVSLFSDVINLDIVYTPKFDPDRYITGRRISYYNPALGRTAGQDAIVNTDKPNDWFADDELALRLYRTLGAYELALYGYRGFWKSPGGQNIQGEAIFPDLNVYGGSLRGTLGKGIVNVETGYYDSADDSDGDNPLINNSELRLLLGYTQELARDLIGGVQYYVEHMVNWNAYHTALPPGIPQRDRNRHVITLRLTQLLMNQNLRVGVFGYYSPSDQDAYLRPNVNYKLTDALSVEGGANVFFGEYTHTFFAQFHRDTNLYAAIRYSF